MNPVETILAARREVARQFVPHLGRAMAIVGAERPASVECYYTDHKSIAMHSMQKLRRALEAEATGKPLAHRDWLVVAAFAWGEEKAQVNKYISIPGLEVRHVANRAAHAMAYLAHATDMAGEAIAASREAAASIGFADGGERGQQSALEGWDNEFHQAAQ